MSQPPGSLIKVFLSSTSKDLGPFRQAAADAVIQREMHPIMMERFPAASRDAVDFCEQKVAEADLFIGIYADRYGYCPNNGPLSITEMEYNWAAQRGIDRLIFVLDKSKATFPENDPIYLHADHNPKMQAFLDRIGLHIVWKTFSSPEDLKYQVSQSLEEWQKRPTVQRQFRSLKDMPGWARWLSLVLLVITSGIVSYSLWQLFRAGQESLGLLTAVIGSAGLLLPLLSFFWKGAQGILLELPGVKRLNTWGLLLLLQLLVAGMVVAGFQPVLRVIADGLVDQALTTTNFNEAHSSLQNAALLGADVSTSLYGELEHILDAPALPDVDVQAIQLARLYAEFTPIEVRQDQAKIIETKLQQAIESSSSAQLNRLAQVLTVLDSAQATQWARTFYADSLAAFTGRPPNTSVAQFYLNGFFAIDAMGQSDLSQADRSYAYYMEGLLLEQSNQPQASLEYYRQALAIDDSNLEARYALSSALLVEAENGSDPVVLNEAIGVAHSGHQDYIEPNFCRGMHNLDNDETFRSVWACFTLMTTEAGGRILRGSVQDTPTTIRGLLDRAIRLAEANAQFGDGYFTAEAYYWLAKLTQPDSSTDEGLALYCAIIQNHDSSSPRHRAWATFANQQLDGRLCF